MSTRSVNVGDTNYNIVPFSGFKALEIGGVISDITEQVPQVLAKMAQFVREYEQENEVRITREMSVLPQFAVFFENMAMTDEKWQQCGGAVSLPQGPSQPLIMAAVFPEVFKYAREQVLALLAWIVIPNRELEEADEAGAVDDLIKRTQKKLLHQGTLGELIELFTVGAECIREELAGKVSDLQSAISALTGMQGDSQMPSTTLESDGDDATHESGEKPNLSTDSPPRTDGPDASPSTTTDTES